MGRLSCSVTALQSCFKEACVHTSDYLPAQYNISEYEPRPLAILSRRGFVPSIEDLAYLPA